MIAICFRFALISYCSVFLSAFAQSFMVQNYTEEDGLAGGPVYDIIQDDHGRIWFSSSKGVVSYDGHNWTLKCSNLPKQPLDLLARDSNGTIWGCSVSKGKPIEVVSFDGDLWQALPTPGPCLQNVVGRSFVVMNMSGTAVPVVSDGVGVQYYKNKVWLPGDIPEIGAIRHLEPHPNGVLILGETGLCLLSEKGISEVDLSLPEGLAWPLCMAYDPADEQAVLWLVGPDWVGYLSDGRFERLASFQAHDGYIFGTAYRMVPDGVGGVLFSDRWRLFHYHPEFPRLNRYDTLDGMVSDGALTMMRDRENNIWTGSRLGVSKIVSMRFANYDRRHGLLDDEVTSIDELSDGRIVFGQEPGFSLYDGQRFRHVLFPQPEKETFRRVFVAEDDGEGGLWAAVWGIGLVHLMSNERLDIYPADKLFGLHRRDGEVLVSKVDGVYSLKGRSLVPFDLSLPEKTYVVRFENGPDGTFYLGTNRGVLVLAKNEQTLAEGPDRRSSSVYSMMLDSKNRLLVGTLSGVLVLVDGLLQPLMEDGSLERPIYFIVEDLQQRYWFGTDNGVFVYDGKRLRHFSRGHGLLGKETNRGAGLVDRRGQVWVGHELGASRFQEAFDRETDRAPLVKIHQVETNGGIFSVDKPVQLDADQHDLVFTYSGVSFINEKQVSYQSWLEGYDEDWLPPYRNPRGAYRYTNLPPGKYRFHLKARGATGSWSPVVSSELITIPKPYFYRPGFIILVGLLLFCLAYSVSDYLSSKRHSRFLAQEVAQRTADLEENTEVLHQRILAHERAEAEIQALNEELEARVCSRTAALEAAQKDLVENAHYAGMAEIANAIIHNVGNILNSVSTSGYLIRQTVQETRLNALLKANELLEEHMDDLAAFVVNDPRGVSLLKFYHSLGQVYERDRGQLLKQTDTLMEKIDTIKDVIAQQHNYASGVYQNEHLDPRHVVETAINIMEASLDAHNIELVRNFEVVPEVVIQKTKFIHTLVNLLKNAKESILSSGNDVRHIEVTIQQIEDEVRIEVTDSGIGIPETHLNRIFSHGFTTIWAKSEGQGRGATFTMCLPAASESLVG